MKTKLLLCLALACSGDRYLVRAEEVASARLETDQRELGILLAKAGRTGLYTNATEATRRDGDFSPYLTGAENERLAKLLCDPKVSRAVTREQALAALKQRQIDGSLPGGQYNALMDLVNRRWPHDPTVIAFCREALAARGDAAIFELWSPQPGVWDDSLLEPVVRLTEKTADWVVMDDALSVLDQHHAVWAKDASIPPRLSQALLKKFPSLTNASLSGPRPGNQMWCNALRMLAKSHDLAMLAVMRPFLKDKTLAGDGSYWMEKDRPPLRACDKAAINIKELLGEKDFIEGEIGMPGTPYWKVHDSYPKWEEWDKKIAELQKRLDRLPKDPETNAR